VKTRGISRRTFVASSFATTLTSLIAGPQWLHADPMGVAPGIQLYTVGDDLKKDPPGALAALRNIGYKYVETAGVAPLSSAAFRKALDTAGLECPSAHVRFTTGDPAPQFEEASTLGARFAVSSVLVARPLGSSMQEAIRSLSELSLDNFKRTAALANEIGRKAKEAGLQYVYHNHNFEFKDLGGGKIGYDILLSETDPGLVKFEADCGWMTVAGHDPVKYFRGYPNRYCMIHVKDFLEGPVTTDLSPSNRPHGTELGRGFIDYKRIFQACKAAGIQYYFSEQEPPFTDMPALQAAKVDYEYMHSMPE
jgi:sugar phosphate isomerase/epimerase